MGITVSGIKFAQDALDKYKVSRDNRKQRTVLEAENKKLQEEIKRLREKLEFNAKGESKSEKE